MDLTFTIKIGDLSDGTDPELVRADIEATVRARVTWMEHDTATVVVDPGPEEQFIVITGSPVDGLSFYGPFADHEEAVRAAYDAPVETDWWVVPVYSPADLLDPNADEEGDAVR